MIDKAMNDVASIIITDSERASTDKDIILPHQKLYLPQINREREKENDREREQTIKQERWRGRRGREERGNIIKAYFRCVFRLNCLVCVCVIII